MKHFKLLLLPILLVFLLSSCEKENLYSEIVEPRPYFPVYPKSWWKYEINDSAIITSSVSNEYKLHKYRTSGKNVSDTLFSEPRRVPFLDSRPIYGYDKIEHFTGMGPSTDRFFKCPIVSEKIGFKFERECLGVKFGDTNEKLEVTAKIFNGTDSVIIVEGYWLLPYPNVVSYQEYAKNIGLTKEFKIDTIKMDTIYKKVLIDYYINN